MNFVESYGKELIALAVPLIGWALNTYFKARAKLILANPHTFTFLVQQPLLDASGIQVSPTQAVHTRSLMVWNAGKESASKIEWVFNWKPLCINVWPSRHYTEYTETDNRFVMIFDSLAPNEYVGCEILSLNQQLPDLITVRSDQCVAKTINMFPQPFVPDFTRRISTALRLAGVALLIYVAIEILQFLILKTPLNR